MSILYQNFTKKKIVKIQNDANRKRKTKKKTQDEKGEQNRQ
jgi:hypothetical protein